MFALVMRQFPAGVCSLGALGNDVGIEVGGRPGRRAVVVVFQHADADRASRRFGRQPERNSDVAAHMTVASQEHYAAIKVGTDRPCHDEVTRHLRARPGRQHLSRQEVAMALGHGGFLFAPEFSG